MPIRFQHIPATDVPVPAADRTTFFIDENGELKFKDETGAVFGFALTEEGILKVTSATRPSDPDPGQLIFETDTDKYVARNAADTAWVDAVPLGAWQDWIPVVTQGSVVAATVSRAKFTQIGSTIIAQCQLAITGTGTSSTGVTVSLPVPAASAVADTIGTMWLIDSSASSAIYHATCDLQTVSLLRFRPVATTTNGFLGTLSFTAALTNGDFIDLSVTYEADS